MKNEQFLIVLGTIFATLIILPIITFFFGWLGGIILSLSVGEHVAYGLNVLLGTNRFTSDQLPVICGTLAIMGGYFKSTQTNNNNKKS